MLIPIRLSAMLAGTALTALLALALVTPANAACSYTGTYSQEGTMRHDGTTLQRCDSTNNWLTVSGAGLIGADSLDYDDFVDAMVLDASTDVEAPTGQSYAFSITNKGTGNSLRVNDEASDTTPFVIDASGNVGIGTTSPDSTLHVNAGSGASLTAKTGFFQIGDDTSGANINTAFDWQSIQTRTGGGLAAPLFINPLGGNVGIGMTAPGAPLEINSSGTTELRLSSSAGFGPSMLSFYSDRPSAPGGEWRPGFIRSGDNGGYTGRLDLFTNGSGSSQKTGSTLGMSIASGKIGIGTTDPQKRLHIYENNTAEVATELLRLDNPSLNSINNGMSIGFHQGALAQQGRIRSFYTGANGWSLNLGAGAADHMTIMNATGNVGMGTNSPGPFRLSLQKSAGVANEGEIRASDGTQWWFLNSRQSSSAYSPMVLAGDAALIYSKGSTETGSLVIAPHSGSEKGIRIDAAGNVGIGVATPPEKLTIKVAADENLGIRSYNSRVSLVSHNDAWNAWNDIGLQHNSVIKGSGAIGVQTQDPQQGLSVQNGMNIDQANLNAGNLTNSLTFGSGSGEGIASKRTPGGNLFGLDFYTGFTSKLSITSAGKVGIGVVQPRTKLDVVAASAAYTEANGGDGAFRIVTGTGAQTDNALIMGVADSGYAWIQAVDPGNVRLPLLLNPNGSNVGIGTASTSYTLHVSGTAYATGAAGALSDIRHKEDIRPLNDGAVELIKKLRPVSFKWKKPIDEGMKGEQLGFIAQEVEDVLPAVVLTQTDKDRTKGIKSTELIPLLTKAVQELTANNDNLRAEMKSLRQKIEMLEAAQ